MKFQIVSQLMAYLIWMYGVAFACPPEMVTTKLSCIDRWENSLLVKQNEGPIQRWSPFEYLNSDYDYIAISEERAHPQGYISANQAKQSCENAGKGCVLRPSGWPVVRGLQIRNHMNVTSNALPTLLSIFFKVMKLGFGHINP